MKIEELKAAVDAASRHLRIAQEALSAFEALPENNVFESLEKAGDLERVLRGKAREDCGGAGNCGCDEYTQEFVVDGTVHVATPTPEYDRHDRTYFDSSKFKIEVKAV
jgi:hypothetical protein